MIDLILREGFPGSEELRSQIDKARVVSSWGSGSVSVDLEVASGVSRSTFSSGVVPVSCVVTDDDGELFGEILVWVTSGMLSGVEYAWYGDESPTAFPRVGQLNISPS
ncbi:hypothetical protein [Nocardiopsis eucommiae]|uniref:hypothetical protein n=1 Tax=Nocardiopsis eucommiae TaxID=2831970 RepID=UPI003D75393C